MDKTISSKKLVRGVFESAELPRLPFVPWIFTHAARLEQIPVQQVFTDPTQYTKCLQNSRKLYGYDAIIGCFDSSLEMEICGCPINWRGTYETPATIPDPGFDISRLNDIDVESVTSKGRFGTTIESLLRINRVMGSNLALAAVVSGPLTLISGLTGSDPLKDFDERPEEAVRAIEMASQFLLKVVKIYCQLELDIIVIAERPLANFTRTHLSHLRSAFSPIVNMIRFYNAFSVLLPGDVNPEGLSEYIDFGFDSMVISNMTVDAWRDIKGNRPCVLGQAIPSHLVLSGGKGLTDYLEYILPHREETGVFLTTDWEIPPETSPDNIHMVMKMVSEH